MAGRHCRHSAGKTIAVSPTDSGTPGSSNSNSDSDSNNLVKRATCSDTQAVCGETRCSITLAQLISYHNDPNLCTDPQVGQCICCSAGSLLNFTPQPNTNSTCKTCTVKSGDNCSAIAQANTMTVVNVENRNKNTWSLTGCSYLLRRDHLSFDGLAADAWAGVQRRVRTHRPRHPAADRNVDASQREPVPVKRLLQHLGLMRDYQGHLHVKPSGSQRA